MVLSSLPKEMELFLALAYADFLGKKIGRHYFIVVGGTDCLFLCIEHAAIEIGLTKTEVECFHFTETMEI